ncbi:MAG: hypothetical protein CENE_03300 [Candidatus Celerinatantimonas neptuna]|nr:MAG: hypothetical protein CENE_03300 [Candidatus Celerinatantimonas neptuna]
MGVLKQVADPITGEPANLCRDTRGKLYITGPLGVYKLQSKRGQAYAEKMLRGFSDEAANDSGKALFQPSSPRTPQQRQKRLFSLWKNPNLKEPNE